MDEQELRELDVWIAEHGFGWSHFASTGLGYLVGLNPESGLPCDVPKYTSNEFATIKREIKRRGWGWRCEYYPGNDCEFAVFVHGAGHPSGYAPRFNGFAETEELAGCLAFKAAVEAMDGD